MSRYAWSWDSSLWEHSGNTFKYLRCKYCGDEVVVESGEPAVKICPECRAMLEMGLDLVN